MENLINLAQLIVAISVLYVWTFRFNNVLKEFEQFGLSDLTRNIVGTTKIALATLLVAGVWYYSIYSYGFFNDRRSIFSFQNK
jgi:hypothetical protein